MKKAFCIIALAAICFGSVDMAVAQTTMPQDTSMKMKKKMMKKDKKMKMKKDSSMRTPR